MSEAIPRVGTSGTDLEREDPMRFIHTSDWQLGMTRHYLAPGDQARFSGDRVETIRRIGELATRVGAAFVVVAGDVFEHHNVGDQVLARALDVMGEMGVEVFLLPGNHDPLSPGSLWSSASFTEHRPDNVHVLDDLGPWPVSDGVELVAAPWRTKTPDHDPLADVLADLPADGTIRVVVGHGMIEQLDPDRTSLDTIRSGPIEDALAAGTIHYVALGDRHIQWPAPDSPDHAHARVRYSGTHESTDFAEPTVGTVLEVELDADGQVSATSHEVGRWQHLDVAATLSGAEDVEDLRTRLAALPRKADTIVRTALSGTLTLAEARVLDEVLDHATASFAALYPWQRHTDLAVVPGDGEFTDLGVSGFARDAAEELTERADGPGPEARTASDALRLLYRLTAGGVR